MIYLIYFNFNIITMLVYIFKLNNKYLLKTGNIFFYLKTFKLNFKFKNILFFVKIRIKYK